MKKILLFSLLSIFFGNTLLAQSWKSQYDNVGEFYSGLAKVTKGNKYGLVNLEGKLIAPVIYDEITQFTMGPIRVKKDRKYGFIDNTGKIILKPQYEEASYFSQGLVPVQMNGKHGYVDINGNTIIEFRYTDALSFSDDPKVEVAWVRFTDKYGLIDKSGNVIIPGRYDYPYGFEGEYAVAKKGEYYGIINKSGKEITEFFYYYTTAKEMLKTMNEKKATAADVKSWAFVSTLIGMSYSDAEKVLLNAGYNKTSSKESSQGRANYFTNGRESFVDEDGEDYDESFNLISKDGKIIGLLIEFLTPKGMSYTFMRDKWKAFEKGFLADGYKKTAEESDTYYADRTYYHAGKKIRIKAHFYKNNGIEKGAEIMMGLDYLKFDD